MTERGSAKKPAKAFVLDSWAVLAYLNKEPACEVIKSRLQDARRGSIRILMHKINLGEVYYIMLRRITRSEADRITNWILLCPISFVDLDDEILFEAARIKAHYPISYADCFVAATAIVKGGSVLTGDPEFAKLEKLLKIEWAK